MEILRYSDLDVRGVEQHIERATAFLRKGDFRSADARKMSGTPFYRARLNDKDRLLFRFVTYGGESQLVLLEVIRNHAYEKSRFLNGVAINENKLAPIPETAPIPSDDLLPLSFLNPKIQRVHILDKILSLDDIQEAAYVQRMPLILIGSAGSGKTVLTLEKMKQLSGDVLYVTHSAYLVENARNLYYAFGYENEAQNLSFLSFKEFVETIRVLPGDLVDFHIFARWFARHRQASGLRDAHQVFEEFNGVLTGSPVAAPYLVREDYLSLGVRRSIFTGDERPRVYGLFIKYLDFLKQENLVDLNLLCFQYQAICRPSYDAIVVDEVQDLTNVQLSLILRTLRNSERFILCGDSNQIVHPNFFSWAALKTLFYEGCVQTSGEIMRILNTNYRNAPEVTNLANRLLLIKNARFGSIDRESHYLVRPVSENQGRVEFLADTDEVKREFDARTSLSTRFAVLVMRPEDKAAAARCFRTPLLFSIQEAKGLEYENIILLNFVSGSAAAFKEIASDVDIADLQGDFRYARAKDKADKSLEAYKFYINALYVAMTRAMRNLYIIEQDAGHCLFRLLDLHQPSREVKLKTQTSSAEEWQAEARRLELQGKKEQAEAIRRRILETQPVPWPVITPAELAQLEAEALNPQIFNRQAKLLLFEYAVMHSANHILPKLAALQFKPALRADAERPAIENKYNQDYQGVHQVLNQKIERYGVDFRNPLNQTPLMVAARLGRKDLAVELIEKGANTQVRDNWGRMPLQIALRQAYIKPEYARSAIGGIYSLLAPSALKVRTGGRLVKLDRHVMEFFLLHSMVALFEDVVRRKVQVSFPAFETGDFVYALESFPETVIPEHRRRRAYLSGVLGRNELHRDNLGARQLFLRVNRGFYVPNPSMEIEVENDWINVCDLLHLDTMDEGAGKRLQNLLGVMRQVRKEGRLQDAGRMQVSPFLETHSEPALDRSADKTRSGETPWKDEWEREDARSHEKRLENSKAYKLAEMALAASQAGKRQTAPMTEASFPRELSQKDTVSEPISMAVQSDAPPEPERIDKPAAIPLAARPAAVLTLPFEDLPPASPLQSVPARIQPEVLSPLPPVADIIMPEYSKSERQLLRRLEFPIIPLPEADVAPITANLDRFRPALLRIVGDALHPFIKMDIVNERRNFLGYIAAVYLLVGVREPELWPLLLKIAADPDLARFHTRTEKLLDLPRALATIAPQDNATLMRLAESPLPGAARGLILRTLALLFFWKRISRESVIQALRHIFEAGIPDSDIDLWDTVVDVCFAVHPHEVMDYLRRQLTPAVCRTLNISRANVESMNQFPIQQVVANARGCAAGPIRGWADFTEITHKGKSICEGTANAAKSVHSATKTGRNDPCPCGSGRKYKKCCGAGK